MLKLVFWFIVLAAAIAGLTWLAAHPGEMSVDWLGYHIDSMPVALAIGVLLFAVFIIWLIVRVVRMIFAAPGAAADFFRLRRRRKGLDELSSGLAALLAGDAAAARAAANRAARLTPDEPATRLLEARAAQELGDDRTARLLLTSMLGDEKTEAAALHGLYRQAVKDKDMTAARGWARRAWEKYPALPWAARAMLAFKAADGAWADVVNMIDAQRKAGLIGKDEANRQKAAALTAMAEKIEERDPAQAIDFALRAHRLDPALVPAATIAGGMLAARGNMRKAAKILEKTWKLSPHPDIAEIYAHLRSGDAPGDRLKRVRNLLRVNGGGEEGAVALARAAIEARDWETARAALRTWLNDNPSSRVYQLMAEIEQEQYGDRGRAREWLARAVRARPGPAWTADGVASPKWLPVSPVSGEIGVLGWKTPDTGGEQPGELGPIPAELLEAPAAPRPEEPARPAEEGEEAATEPEKQKDQPLAEEKPLKEAAEDAAPQTGKPEVAETEDAESAKPVKEESAAGEETSAEKKEAAPANKTAPPPPGQAPAAPPVIELRAHKPGTEKPGADKAADKETPQEQFKAPIPDDPGPKPREEKKKKGWFG